MEIYTDMEPTTLHETLEKKHSGISKGILTKKTLNKEFYNQDISNLALVSIGGYENTLEEECRTIEALAEAIQEILNDNSPTNLRLVTQGRGCPKNGISGHSLIIKPSSTSDISSNS
jgi:hypothetical protein